MILGTRLRNPPRRNCLLNFFLLFKKKMIKSYELKNPKKSILNMYQSKCMDICFIPVHAPEWLDLETEKGLPNLKLSRLFLIQPIIFSLFIFSSLEFLSYCYKSIKIKSGLWPRIIVKMPACEQMFIIDYSNYECRLSKICMAVFS